MVGQRIAVFLNTLPCYEQDRATAVISRADCELVNALATRYELDLFYDGPRPLNASLLTNRLYHYLYYYKLMRQGAYANVLFLIWSSGYNRYMFPLLESVTGLVILREPGIVRAYSEACLAKLDFRKLIETLSALQGRAGRLLSRSLLLGLPTTQFLIDQIGFEPFFYDKMRGMITNYDPIFPHAPAQTSLMVPHHISLVHWNAPVLQKARQNTMSILILSDVIPCSVQKLVYDALSRLRKNDQTIMLYRTGIFADKPGHQDHSSSPANITECHLTEFMQARTAQLPAVDCIIAFNCAQTWSNPILTSPVLTALTSGKPVITFSSRPHFESLPAGLTYLDPKRHDCIEQLEDLFRQICSGPSIRSDVDCTSVQVQALFRSFSLENLLPLYDQLIEATAAAYYPRSGLSPCVTELQAQHQTVLAELLVSEKAPSALKAIEAAIKEFETIRFYPL
ncbi:hypothetical protein JXQ70_13745 [bacterium]|nr:hypothetical protein [bacterium]